MSFLHPLLLWGALLGTIPIIIHILSRRRYRVVRWAAMEFLLQALSERSRNVRIQDLILLALRVGVLVIAALLVARPILTPSAASSVGLSSSAVDAVFLFDGTYSMGTTSAGQTRFDTARERSREILETLPTGSQIAVVQVGTEKQDIVPLTPDKAQIASAIDGLDISAAGADADCVGAIQSAMTQLDGSSAAKKHIYLFTDGQSAMFEPQAERFREIVASSSAAVGYTVVKCGTPAQGNVYVHDLRIRNRGFQIGAPVEIDAQVTAVAETSSVEAELWVADRKVARQVVTFDGTHSKAVSFRHVFTAAGLNPIEVRLTADTLELDNHAYVAVYIPETLNVVVVEPDANDGELPTASTFIRAALSGSSDQEASTTGMPACDVHVIPPSRIADEMDTNVDVAILASPGELSSQAREVLDNASRTGTAFILAMGPRDRETLSGLSGSLDWLSDLQTVVSDEKESQATGFDGARLAELAEDAGDTALAAFLVDAADVLGQVNVFQATAFTAKADSAWRTALSLKNGEPALLARRIGVGSRLIVLQTSLDPTWTDLPYRPAMVPLLHNMIHWARRDRSVSAGLAPGEAWTLATTTDGQFVPPSGDSLPADAFKTSDGLRFDRTASPGVYRFQSTDAPTDALAAVAVNVDVTESDPTLWTRAQLQDLFPPGRGQVLTGDQPLAANELAGMSGHEAWMWFAALLALLLLVEAWLAFKFGATQTPAPRGVPA